MSLLAELYWDISKETAKSSRRTFMQHLQNFDLQSIMVGNEVAGCIALRGNEIHICVKPEYRRRWMGKWFYKLLDDLADSYGSAMTYVFEDQPVAMKFVSRLGFEVVASGDGIAKMERRR